MPSKSLKAVWSFMSFCLLAAGAIAIAFSIVWRSSNVTRNFIISNMDLNAGLAMGIMLVVTWMISVGGILQQNHVVIGLIITNWVLIADAIAVLVIGAEVWFYTLRPIKNFLEQWTAASPQVVQGLQDTLRCCGYQNSTDHGLFAGFCADSTFAAAQPGCASIILPMADYTLNNVFSSVFGFMAIVIGMFLATTSMIYRRNEQERFRKIDEKRGGRSFV